MGTLAEQKSAPQFGKKIVGVVVQAGRIEDTQYGKYAGVMVFYGSQENADLRVWADKDSGRFTGTASDLAATVSNLQVGTIIEAAVDEYVDKQGRLKAQLQSVEVL